MLLSLVLNLLIPVVVLKKGAGWLGEGQTLGLEGGTLALVLALLFPTIYFIYDWFNRRKINGISILGFVSILLTGGIGVMKLSPGWFIAKEGGIPLIIGIIILISTTTKKPLVKLFLYNEAVFNVPLIDQKLKECNSRRSFKDLIRFCSYLISGSFFISSMIQFFLAGYIVTADPSKDNYEQIYADQVGTMTWVSYVVILVPSFLIMGYALWKLIKGIEGMTGLKMEEMMNAETKN